MVGSTDPVKSHDDVIATQKNAESVLKEAKELNQTVAAVLLHTYDTSIAIIPKKAYSNLENLAKSVVQEACGGAKADFPSQTTNTVAAYKEALDVTGSWIDKLWKWNEAVRRFIPILNYLQ